MSQEFIDRFQREIASHWDEFGSESSHYYDDNYGIYY